MSSDLQDHTNLKDPRQRRSRETTTLEPSPDTSAGTYAQWGEQCACPAEDPFAPAMDFSVDLAIFRGPIDLLLYLVRKHELDIMDIPVAMITDQYLKYLEVLQELSIDDVGDFVEVASLLIESKSRTVLPQNDEEVTEQTITDDPREELVERLLEYKKYKDAASMLHESGREWQQRFPRVANDLPARTHDIAEQPIREVELWDLVSAIGRIMRDSQRLKPLANIVYDDTPIQVYMQQLHDRLIRQEEISFSSMFEPGMHKARMIGIFLAILELARNYGVVVEQVGFHGELLLKQGADFQPTLELSEVFSDFNEADSQDIAAPKPR